MSPSWHVCWYCHVYSQTLRGYTSCLMFLYILMSAPHATKELLIEIRASVFKIASISQRVVSVSSLIWMCSGCALTCCMLLLLFCLLCLHPCSVLSVCVCVFVCLCVCVSSVLTCLVLLATWWRLWWVEWFFSCPVPLPLLHQSVWEEVSEQASAGPLPWQPDGPQLLRLPHGEDAHEQAEQEPPEAAIRQQQPEQGENKLTVRHTPEACDPAQTWY